MMPKVNFRDMFHNASPLTKGVVYTMLGLIGTVETYTYGLWIWHYFYPPLQSGQVEGGADDAGT